MAQSVAHFGEKRSTVQLCSERPEKWAVEQLSTMFNVFNRSTVSLGVFNFRGVFNRCSTVPKTSETQIKIEFSLLKLNG